MIELDLLASPDASSGRIDEAAATWRLRLSALGGLLAVVSLSCSSAPAVESDGVRGSTQALTATQTRVLGFEAPSTDWTSANAIGQSTTHSQGALSLSVKSTGWTEIVSRNLDSLGQVSSTLSFDLRLPQAVSWGEARVVVVIPSKSIWWADIGGRSLVGLSAGTFQTLQFTVPANVLTALRASYSDLQLHLVLSADTGPNPCLVDNVNVGQTAAPDQDVVDDPTKAKLNELQALATAAEAEYQSLLAKVEQAAQVDLVTTPAIPAELVTAIRAAASSAATASNTVAARAEALAAPLKESGPTLTSLSRAAQKVGESATAEATAMGAAEADGEFATSKLGSLAKAAKGALRTTASEA